MKSCQHHLSKQNNKVKKKSLQDSKLKEKQNPQSQTKQRFQISTYHFRILATSIVAVVIEVSKEKGRNDQGKEAEKEGFEKGGSIKVRFRP